MVVTGFDFSEIDAMELHRADLTWIRLGPRFDAWLARQKARGRAALVL